LAGLNATDEITGIYGLYRSNDGKLEPISSYSDYEQSPASGTSNPISNIAITTNGESYLNDENDNLSYTGIALSENSTRNEAPAFEVTTASGKVYGFELTSTHVTSTSTSGIYNNTDTYGMVNVKDSSDVPVTTNYSYID
jgi:hypothetical protein